MKDIFGVFCRDAECPPRSILGKMQAEITSGNAYDCQLWQNDYIGLGQAFDCPSSVTHTTRFSLLPRSDNLIFIAAGRLDNASELCSLLNIPELERPTLSEFELMRHAYSIWGRECSARMFGDWVFAAWHPTERQLIICRSHYSCIALYYHIDQNIFAFASTRQALLASNLVPIELDELWLAQYITSWHAYYGERTPHKPIKCLPPAHYLVVTQSNCVTCRYWHPGDKAELFLSRREEYAEVFRSIFDEAVKCRLRSDMPIAVSLSGGLDSGSVAATAARILAVDGRRLTAFTSVPSFDTQKYLPATHFGDEFIFAKATADYSGNIDLYPLTSAEISPIKGIRLVLRLGRIPAHGAANLYWMMDVQQSAIASGCRVLLTGAAGNGGFSWTGYESSQPMSFLLSHFEWRIFLQNFNKHTKQILKSALPKSLLFSLQKRRLEQQGWYRQSAIHPDFARRIRLLEQRLNDPGDHPPRNPREEQSLITKPGRSVVGAYNAEIGAAKGLEVRDPTCDARMLDFVFSVPDHIFIDPKTGLDRCLVREAMKGRLPDEVRLNRKRGRQGADMVPRLRGCAAEVESTLDELARGPAAEYVDVEYMRKVWQMTKSKDTSETRIATSQILLRGIMAGLFVNSFYD